MRHLKEKKNKANSHNPNLFGSPFFSPKIQTKLNIGKANDKYEKEADSMADQVVNNTNDAPAIQKMGNKEEIQQKPLAESVTPFVQKMEGEEEPIQQMAQEEESIQKMEEEESVQKKEEEEAVQKQEEEEAVQAKCDACQHEEKVQKKDEEKEIQTKKEGKASPKQSSVESKLQNSKGKGSPMNEPTNAFMSNSFGTDFSNVKIHTDDNAVQMSKDLGAKAFTNGNDIYFNKGQYNPESKEGKHLLAHELTHTIQQGKTSPLQRNKNKAIQNSPLNLQQSIDQSAPLMIQRVPTHFGDFDTIQYNDVKSTESGNPEVGINMHLKFSPNNNVDSSKIGLVQIAKGTFGGAVDTAGYRGRRMTTSGEGQGYAVDHLPNHPSPVYHSKSNPNAGANQQDMASYDVNNEQQLTAAQTAHVTTNMNVTGISHGGGATYGFRYYQSGTLQGPQDATLHDAPHNPNVPVMNNSGQIFETTAVAISGTQQGMYYGSVQWGWERDGSGNFTRLPLSIVSMGVPSNTFMSAALVWNNATENIGRATSVALPNSPEISIASGSPVVVQGSSVNIPNNTQIEILASGQANTTNVFFARVTVSGNTVVTIVPVASTKQIDIGRPTVDLPIVDVFVVNQAGGVALNQGMPYMPNTNLPNGTRVKETGFSGPFQAGDPRNNMIEVEVVDGPLTSTIGWLSHTVLTQEVRGTR